MRSFKTLEELKIPMLTKYERRNKLRQWFDGWAFTEPQRRPGNGAPIMTDRQLEQYEFKLLNEER